jgi:NADH-quinone oxidoreductase subunit C
MDETKITEKISAKYPDLIIDSHTFRGDATVTIKKGCGLEFFDFLRKDPEFVFDFLMDITAVDYLGRKTERFEVVYHFFSMKFKHRVRIKIPVCEKDCQVQSLTSMWKTADWYEREIWDMYGIKFEGHGNMKRILLYEEFQGHPLRKDYPVNKRQPLIGPLN